MKPSHSCMPIRARLLPRIQELVFDAHDKAFEFYGGICRRGIYDNMKTAVEAIFVGKARQIVAVFSRRAHIIWSSRCLDARIGRGRDRSKTRSAICAISCSGPSRGYRAWPS